MPTKEEIKDQIENETVIKRTDVELEKLDKDAEVDSISETTLLDLTDEQIQRLKGEVFDLFEEIAKDHTEHSKKWDGYQAQYDGKMDEANTQMEFNLNVPVTQVKCDALERLALKSFLQSDPKFSVELRPEAMRQGMDIADIERVEKAQAEYLDYQLDERINISSPLRRTIHQATKFEGGFMKVPYVYKTKQRDRDEFYSGRKVVVNERQIPEGLQAFLQNYPKAQIEGEEGHEYYLKLLAFEDVKFEASYTETVYDDAKPMFVDCRDFFARKSTEGYDGLCDEQFYCERIRYTYYDMKKLEKDGKMEHIDDCKYVDVDKKDIDSKYHLKEHNILECTYHFKLHKDDEEEVKIICQFNEENRSFHGAYEYPYTLVDCIYVPFYITDKEKGLYKSGLAAKLTDDHLAQNAMLNLMLSEAWLDMITTPIVRNGSSAADQILSGRWKEGIPLILNSKESIAENIDFMPKSRGGSAIQLIPLLQFMSQYTDKRTGINDIAASGQNDPTDPGAPAAKTAMLLKQSGINIEDYIDCLLPSFNKVAEIILKHSYQAATEGGRKYRQKQKSKRVAGSEPFSFISRDDMIMETVIQSRASAFAFDKLNEKQENLAIYQLLRQEPLIAQNPKAVHNMVHSLLESWSPMWKAKADKIALSVDEIDEQLKIKGVQALNIYMKQLQEAAKVTGQEPNPDIKEYLGIVSSLMNQAVNPQEEQKDG